MTKVVDAERISEYLVSLEPRRSAELSSMREFAASREIPIVREETEAFLSTMVRILKPGFVLELGTAIGYSAIVMAEAAPKARITTVENNPAHISKARGFVDSLELSGRIDIAESEIGEYLTARGGTEKFDLVFLDAAKGQYLKWLPLIESVMKPGSVLIADNVLQKGHVAESRYLFPHRERSTLTRMREFLYTLKHSKAFETSVIPLGDGVSISVFLDRGTPIGETDNS